MKKIFEKLIAISLAVMSLIFVVFLLVMIFDSELAAQANNTVVHALFIVFALVLAALTTLNILFSFLNHDRVNQILLFKTKSGTKKASVSVVKSLAKQAVSVIPNIKISGIHLIADDNNEVIFRANIALNTSGAETNTAPDVAKILENVNAALEIEFRDVLNLIFKDIELKLTKTKITYSPSLTQVEDNAKKSLNSTQIEASAPRQPVYSEPKITSTQKTEPLQFINVTKPETKTEPIKSEPKFIEETYDSSKFDLNDYISQTDENLIDLNETHINSIDLDNDTILKTDEK